MLRRFAVFAFTLLTLATMAQGDEIRIALNGPTSQTVVRGAQDAVVFEFTISSETSVEIHSLPFLAETSEGAEFWDVKVWDVEMNAVITSAINIVTDPVTLPPNQVEITFTDTHHIAAGESRRFQVTVDAPVVNQDGAFLRVASLPFESGDVVRSDTGSEISLQDISPNTLMWGQPLSVVAVGGITIAKAADDAESAAGIIVAGREEVLGKFRLAATNEDMRVNNLVLAVTPDADPHSTSSAAADEISTIKLYDGAVQIGDPATAAGGYPVALSGAFAGWVFVNNLGWKIPKDESRTLVVKGVVNTIAQGADSGASVYVHILDEEFEAQGSTAKVTTIGGPVSGNQKVVHKTRPAIFPASQSYALRSGSAQPSFAFTVVADVGEDVSWKQFELELHATDADILQPDQAPGATGNVSLKRIGSSVSPNLTIARVSGNGITSGSSGYFLVVLANEEVISAGTTKTYEVGLPFANLVTDAGANPSVSMRLALRETDTLESGRTFEEVAASDSSFIWSDNSVVAHSETTPDWHNGRYVPGLPGPFTTITKGGSSGGGGSTTSPPTPTLLREEVFHLESARWTFFAPVGIPYDPNFRSKFPVDTWEWNAIDQRWSHNSEDGFGFVSLSASREEIPLLTRARDSATLHLEPKWNLIGFTRFPSLEDGEHDAVWLQDVLRVALEQGVALRQLSFWSQTDRRYMSIGLSELGEFWSTEGSLVEITIHPGNTFFTFLDPQFSGADFDPSEAWIPRTASPSRTPMPMRRVDEDDVPTPPSFPTGPDPRGKGLMQWGALKATQ